MPSLAITGANSAVGTEILSQLEAKAGRVEESAAWSCTAIVRSERAQTSLQQFQPAVSVRVIDYADRATLADVFKSCDAVIHLPGVLIERKGSTYREANVETARSVIAAAAKNPSCKFVLVSAVGADAGSKNRYYASKGEAENLLRESGLPFTIVRAPLVLGAGTEGTQALLRHVASGAPRLLGGGRQLQQPIDVRDLARGCLSACRGQIALGQALDLVGPVCLAERELLSRTAAIVGKDVKIGSIPVGVVRFAARIRTAIAGPGFSADAVDVICDDTKFDPRPAAEALELELTPLETTLTDMCSEAT